MPNIPKSRRTRKNTARHGKHASSKMVLSGGTGKTGFWNKVRMFKTKIKTLPGIRTFTQKRIVKWTQTLPADMSLSIIKKYGDDPHRQIAPIDVETYIAKIQPKLMELSDTDKQTIGIYVKINDTHNKCASYKVFYYDELSPKHLNRNLLECRGKVPYMNPWPTHLRLDNRINYIIGITPRKYRENKLPGFDNICEPEGTDIEYCPEAYNEASSAEQNQPVSLQPVNNTTPRQVNNTTPRPVNNPTPRPVNNTVRTI